MKKKDIFKVGVNWQVVLPQQVREALGVRKGDYVSFSIEDGEVKLKKVLIMEAMRE